MRPLFVSFYSGDAYYRRCAAALGARCDALGVPILIEARTDLGGYWRNTLQKPIFLLEKMRALDRDLIWIDADTDLRQDHPEFRALRADVTFASHSGDLSGIKASPIGVARTPAGFAFVEAWAQVCRDRLAADEIDLDHDILKYEILPAFASRLTMRMMGDPARPRAFTDGCVVTNGLSGRSRAALPAVLRRNRLRADAFAALRIEHFGRAQELR